MLSHSYDVKAPAEWRKIGIAIMYGSLKNGSTLGIGNYCFGIGRRAHIQSMVGYMESRSFVGDVINTRANCFRADGVSGYAGAGREDIQARLRFADIRTGSRFGCYFLGLDKLAKIVELGPLYMKWIFRKQSEMFCFGHLFRLRPACKLKLRFIVGIDYGDYQHRNPLMLKCMYAQAISISGIGVMSILCSET